LTQCPYIDSTVIRVLLRAQKVPHAKLRIVAPAQGDVRRVLAIAGVEQLLTVAESLDEALRSL
jgi:anti-anti-sigma regulatory factor